MTARYETATKPRDPDALGTRMKEYEAAECKRRFMPLLPVYARIDGRNFSKFTRDMDRPYDVRLSAAMIETTRGLVEHTHATMGYTQSDEISLCWYSDEYAKGIFFDGKIVKMTSVLAGLATALFTRAVISHHFSAERAEILLDRLPHFDDRVIQLPNQTEVANMFLWRELDACKNAVSMAARAYYSHNQLHGMSASQMQELLFLKGVNFNDYPAFFKRGTFVRRVLIETTWAPDELTKIPEKYRPSPDATVVRSQIIGIDMPKFSTVTNREAVIFDGADPVLQYGKGVKGE